MLIAYECIHYLRNKKGKSGACAIKLDMAKVYDRVEWRYLEAVMKAMGFSARWKDLVMKCVTTVSFFSSSECPVLSKVSTFMGIRSHLTVSILIVC